MNFGIYARKSYFTNSSESTKMQVDSCRDYIDQKFDEIGDTITYEDDGYIRSNIDRPGMNQLRKDVADGLIDCVVIYRIDRVCSQMIDFCTFYTFLKERNIKFVTVKDGIDTTTPIGEAMMYLAVIFSGIEIGNDTIRITDNMNHLAASGFWCGGQPPLGYKIQQISFGKKSHKTLIADPEGLTIKNQIVDLFLDHNFSLQQFETHCRIHGITAPSGKLYSTTTLHQILTSPMCVENTPEIYDYFEALGCQMDEDSSRDKWDGKHGVIVYGRTATKKRSGKKMHTSAPATNWRVSIGYHKPTMSADKWLQIQQQFTHNSFCKTAKYSPTLLKGVLRCKCGRLMGLAWKRHADGTVVSWYKCPRRERFGTDACDMRQTSTELLDNKVLSIFRQIEADPNMILQYCNTKKIPEVSTESIRDKIKKNDSKIAALTSALAENSTSSAAKYIVGQIEKIDIDQTRLHGELSKILRDKKEETRQLQSAEKKRADIIRLLSDFDQFTPEERNAIACNVIISAVWDGEILNLML